MRLPEQAPQDASALPLAMRQRTTSKRQSSNECNASVMLENATQALCWKMQRACVAAPTAPRKAELASGAGWALQRMNMV
jgi:hypothetical protein